MSLCRDWRQLSILTPPGAASRHLTWIERWRMAERKGPQMVPPQGQQSGKEMSEKSPNPHGEHKVVEMPIRTQQHNATSGKNVPKVPNTVGGNLNPSVAHDFENRATGPKKPEDKRASSAKETKRKDA